MPEANGHGSQIFLSYAHIDNEKIDTTHRGWVDYFYTVLAHELRQRKGEEVHFWRDKRDLLPNDFFDHRILTAVDRSRLFVAVVSPVYLTRDYCVKELQRFCDGPDMQARAERTLKILKRRVVNTPTDGDLPFPLGGREGFKFFLLNDDDKRQEVLFWDDAEGEVDPRYKKFYWSVIRQIADEIERHLRNDYQPARQNHIDTDVPTVYLAPASFDRKEDYWAIRGELERKLGATIVPEDGDLPNQEADVVATVDRALERAVASVHLLGATPGHTPDGPTKTPVVPLQLARAGARARSTPGFRRLMWAPPALAATDPHQLELIQGLRSGAHLLPSDEYVCEPLERFKNHLVDCIREASGKPRKPQVRSGPPVVFLVCQPEDEEAALALRLALFEEGMEVRMPEFEGTPASQEAAFAHHAATADAAIVFLGAALESWVIATLDRLHDWQTLGRKKAFVPCAVVVGAGATARKQQFKSHRVDLIMNGLQVPMKQAVSAFLERIART